MGRREDRLAAEKKPLRKKWWFWFLLLLLLGGGGFAASQFISFDSFDFAFWKSSTDDSGTEQTKTSTEDSTTADDITHIIELYQSVNLTDSLDEEKKGSSYDEVVELLGEPSSNVESELGDSKTKMAIWNTFNGKTTISVNFKDDFAIGKSASKLATESETKTTMEQFDAVPLDGSYTYDQAVKEFGQPDSLSTSFIGGVDTLTAFWSTNTEQSITIHFDDTIAVSKEQVSQ